MSGPRKTAIVTGASQGIGAGIVKGFVERGFNVVANSRKVTQSTEVAASDHVALVDGHIGEPATAAKIVETALSRFKSIDVLVNNAGIFFTKPFTDYTAEDFKSLVSTNVEGFLYVTQLSIKQMLAQKTGGSIVTNNGTITITLSSLTGGTIAFTDWISGTVPMSAEESGRFLRFMSFPNVQDVEGYRGLLEGAGCTVMTAGDTGRFAPYVDLSISKWSINN